MAASKDQVIRLRRQLNQFQQDADNTVASIRNRMDEESCTDQELSGIEENVRTWTNQLNQQKERNQNKQSPTPGYR